MVFILGAGKASWAGYLRLIPRSALPTALVQQIAKPERWRPPVSSAFTQPLHIVPSSYPLHGSFLSLRDIFI